MKLLLVRPKEMPGNRPLLDADYVVRPKTHDLVDPITHLPIALTPSRLVAEFRGTPPSFDSMVAQRRYGWTDDERIMVETHLLKHKHYGRGFYLFPGETLPEEYEPLVGTKGGAAPTVTTRSDGTCAFVTRQWPLEVCGADALPGTDLCDQHFREVEQAAAQQEEEPKPKPSKARDKDKAVV